MKAGDPSFVFLAEADWDLEYALQQQGFGYCIRQAPVRPPRTRGAESVRCHLTADLGYQPPRAVRRESRRAARGRNLRPGTRASCGRLDIEQTGARLVHDGQLEGRLLHLPVFLGRRPAEPPDDDRRRFYDRRFRGLDDSVFRTGTWQLGERSGWHGDDTGRSLVARGWRGETPRKLVVVNLGDARAAGHVSLTWDDLQGRTWRLSDASSGAEYERSGDDLRGGLYVELDGWGWHLFNLTPL